MGLSFPSLGGQQKHVLWPLLEEVFVFWLPKQVRHYFVLGPVLKTSILSLEDVGLVVYGLVKHKTQEACVWLGKGQEAGPGYSQWALQNIKNQTKIYHYFATM